jgi:hypothetical protein
MNRKYSLSLLSGIFLVIGISLTSCYRDSFGLQESGPIIAESCNSGSFNGVDLSIDANVILHEDSFCHVIVHAQSNFFPVLKTSLHGSTLSVGFSRTDCDYSPITIDLYAPSYVLAKISGSGPVQSDNAVITGDFTAGISGSGFIELDGLQANSTECTISGSGSIRLSGTSASVKTHTSGSGDMHLFGLAGQYGTVDVSGSGNVEINVSQTLDVEISGSGDVYYKGTPAVDADISGSGHLHHVN